MDITHGQCFNLGEVAGGCGGWPAGNRSQFPQVPGYFTTGERIADIYWRPMLTGRGDDAGAFLRQGDASGISDVT